MKNANANAKDANAKDAQAQARLILFDFDGTLADTAADMLTALNRWRAARKLAAVPLADARKLCSGGVRALLGISGWDGEDFGKARAEYLRYYDETGYTQTHLFAGVREMLANISAAGWRWGVVTNKPRAHFVPIANRLQLRAAGACVLVCGDDVATPKPAADVLELAAQQCNTTTTNCIYVGDDERDALAAQAAGMPFVAVTWGYWSSNDWQARVHALLTAPPLLLAAVDGVVQYNLQK